MQNKILIFSEAFGNGHTKAAEALAQSISIQEPAVRTKIVELANLLHPLASNLTLRSYKKMITAYPRVWRKIYDSNQNQPISERMQYVIYQLFHRKMEQILENERPQMAICTHPFTSSSLSRLKRLGHPVRFCTVITDFHAHSMWIQPEVDLYMVSDHEVQRQLISMGIPSEKIAVTGIPVTLNFWTKRTKQEARNLLNLKNLPTILVMGGGLGLGGIRELAYSLVKWKERVQIIICTGNNDNLRLHLQHDKQFHHPNIVILGFVDNIDKLLDASDLLITKPGGLTCFESLSKGVPMLIFQPIPGHEERNCNYLEKRGLAVRMDHVKRVDNWIEKLLFASEAFEPLRKNIEQFRQQFNPLAAAETVLDLLHKQHKNMIGMDCDV
ncbi:MGDG synthase family glycosyltransferase [Ferviditalea candida]|uniref:Glycosyltransferase n=1 Tax=Ferviditalea candida TaxID=3108399 RepID=A0ABU5ZK49_9BACL|nr:glycosyltransferase [Paenibacillaceae bacterium T2]